MQGIEQATARARELMTQEQGPASVLADALSRRVAAQSDRSLLPEVLDTFFRSVDDATLVATLALLSKRGRGGNARYRRVAMELALNAQLFARMPYDRIQDLHAIARGAGQPEICALFLSSPHDPRGTLAEDAGPENPHLEIALGRRKAAARGRDRDTLDRLMRDRNPQVIALLLNNSILTEQDVVRIAAMRPGNPDCLEVVSQHPKWAQHYHVRKALACNPRTPHPIAEKLMRTLMRQDLAFIAGTSNLPDRVRNEARRAMEEVPGGLPAPRKKKPGAILRGRPAGELTGTDPGSTPD